MKESSPWHTPLRSLRHAHRTVGHLCHVKFEATDINNAPDQRADYKSQSINQEKLLKSAWELEGFDFQNDERGVAL